MATINGTHVNFVKVPTLAKFNDIASKVDGTVYFIVDEKKIHLDGVMYGFNDSDIDLTPFFRRDGSLNMQSNIDMDDHDVVNVRAVQALSSNIGLYLQHGTMDEGSIMIETVDKEHLVEGDYARASFSPQGLEFWSSLGKKVTIKGLSVVEHGETEFERLHGDYALAAGTLQNFKGAAGGFAELDGTGKVPAGQLPSFVDDVIEVNNYASLPTTGEKGKLYVTIDNNHLYRWSGSAWVNVSDGNAHLILGTTSSTAYRGDHGLIAYNHTTNKSNPHSVTKAQVGLGSVENYGKATQAEAEAGTSDAKYMTPLRTKNAIETLAPKLAWTVVA